MELLCIFLFISCIAEAIDDDRLSATIISQLNPH